MLALPYFYLYLYATLFPFPRKLISARFTTAPARCLYGLMVLNYILDGFTAKSIKSRAITLN